MNKPALDKVQESIEAKIIEQLARDVHESMRGPVEAGKVLYRKRCTKCNGISRADSLKASQAELDATTDPTSRARIIAEMHAVESQDDACTHCKGVGFEPFEEYDQLAPVVKEGRIMAAKWLFDHYFMQRKTRA